MVRQHFFSLPLWHFRICLSSLGAIGQASREVWDCHAGAARANVCQGLMQVPSSCPLPVAGSDRAEGVPCPSLGDMLLWTALLFLGESGSQRDRSRCQEGEGRLTESGLGRGCWLWQTRTLVVVSDFCLISLDSRVTGVLPLTTSEKSSELGLSD